LEAVNTVVLGKTRAKQYYTNDAHRTGCMPILLHGDGAFSGQVGRRGRHGGQHAAPYCMPSLHLGDGLVGGWRGG